MCVCVCMRVEEGEKACNMKEIESNCEELEGRCEDSVMRNSVSWTQIKV